MPTWDTPPLPARFAAAADEVFVGRRAELAQLETVWARVEAGARQSVFVGGAAGSGKSRLVAEVARALHPQDVTVLLGTCSADLGVPYSPLVAALDHLLVGTAPGSLAHVLPDAVGELSRVTPHVRLHRDDLDASTASEHEVRRELFDAYVAAVESVAAERPLALVVEDLHWASAPTLLLLGHLLRSPTPVPLLVLATMRDTAPERSAELTSFVADAYRAPDVHRIDLGGLGTDDIAAYLVARGGVDRSDIAEAAVLLAEQTGGNAFFLRELWRDLEGRGGVHALRSGDFAAPRSVRDTLEARLRSFDSAARQCLELAAVLGDTFEVGDIAAASGRDREHVLQALDRARDADLVEYDAASGTFGFRHALVRQAVREGLSAARSATLHAGLADVVAARSASQPELDAVLARLYDGARTLGYTEERVRHLSAAAAHARRGLAHEEAAQLSERAARVTVVDRTRTDHLLLASADSHVCAGDFADARRIYREVASSPDARTALRAAIGHENASWRPGLGGHESLALLSDALVRVDADPADPLYVHGLIATGRAHGFDGDVREAARVSSAALGLARGLADDRLVAEALAASMQGSAPTPGSIAVHHQRAVELRRLALDSRDHDKLGPAGSYLSLTSYMAGDPVGWRAGLEDIELAAERTGQPFWRWVEGCYRFCQQFIAGEFAAAEATVERTRRLGGAFGADDTEGPYGIQMFLLRRETGGLEQVRPVIPQDPDGADAWLPGLLAVYSELGMDEPAQRLLRMQVDGLADADRASSVWPAIVAFTAQAAIRLADAEALDVVEPLLADYDGFNLVVGQCVAVLGSANLLLAQVCALRGDGARAEAHFETALAIDGRTRSTVHRAETLARYAAFLAGRGRPGDRDRAGLLRREAHALAEPRTHRRVLDLLARAGGAPELPDNLSRRELDVLQLLAEGASNAEIGRRLYISQNTAANHVRSILTKTGTANRTQAAIYAVEQGLINPRTDRRTSRRAAADRRPL